MTKTREVQFIPAYDLGRQKGQGIGSAQIRFILNGPKGAVHFVCDTNWYLPATVSRLGSHLAMSTIREIRNLFKPMGFELGYHSQFKDKGITRIDCDILDQGYCYYDGSSSPADDFVDTLIAKGSDGVWEELEQYYQDIFESD